MGDSIIVRPNPNGLIDKIKSWLGFDTKYQIQVKANLEQLKKDDKVVGEMITELEESNNIHEITMPDERFVLKMPHSTIHKKHEIKFLKVLPFFMI